MPIVKGPHIVLDVEMDIVLMDPTLIFERVIAVQFGMKNQLVIRKIQKAHMISKLLRFIPITVLNMVQMD